MIVSTRLGRRLGRWAARRLLRYIEDQARGPVPRHRPPQPAPLQIRPPESDRIRY